MLADGRNTWEGGLGTAWSNVPAQDLTVVVLTQRGAGETRLPVVCETSLPPPARRVNHPGISWPLIM